jgi:serine/threonine protein kinase
VAGGFGHSYPSDIWSFGVILYRMRYGICPFETSSLQETIQRIKLLDYEFSKWVAISNDLKDLISKILLIDYDARLTIPEI